MTQMCAVPHEAEQCSVPNAEAGARLGADGSRPGVGDSATRVYDVLSGSETFCIGIRQRADFQTRQNGPDTRRGTGRRSASPVKSGQAQQCEPQSTPVTYPLSLFKHMHAACRVIVALNAFACVCTWRRIETAQVPFCTPPTPEASAAQPTAVLKKILLNW